MKPLNGTVSIIAPNHFTKGDLMTETVRRLIWVDRHI
uniref:Uncharacterized protein n=1 Tax=Amphimedon queenslandica TaxID=400682 RepID=A0A1X7V561_AMPQE